MYRRRLPHWRQAGAVYFVTWRIARGTPPLSAEERSLVVNALAFFDTVRYDIYGYAVMDDHVHVIVEPFSENPLEKITASWKSFTANQMQRRFGRTGWVWLEESFDRVIRHEQEYMQKLEYVLKNPMKRWPDAVDYAWVGMSLEGHPSRGAGGR